VSEGTQNVPRVRRGPDDKSTCYVGNSSFSHIGLQTSWALWSTVESAVKRLKNPTVTPAEMREIEGWAESDVAKRGLAEMTSALRNTHGV
jgi:hypothetical protein